jgi:NAD(P)H-dependent flavin oxidoreductase YrpB (nitropropane dioxygenase family)
MLTTRFTDLVGCSIPIQRAGMGALAPPELAAAVSEAGAPMIVATDRTSEASRHVVLPALKAHPGTGKKRPGLVWWSS